MSKRLVVFLLSLLPLSTALHAQRRISADVEVKTVVKNNVSTTTKSVYCTNNGRLVVSFHKPIEYILLCNTLGESKMYFPSSNEVYVDNTGAFTSRDELLSIFLLGRFDDLGLTMQGYQLLSTERLPDGLVKKTYKTQRVELPPLCEIVYQDYLPIYSATLTPDGQPTQKVYYSKYQEVGYMPFPCRSTQIIYNSPKDSTIIRSIYSNIELDGDDPLFEFTVPENARPLDVQKQKAQ